MGGRKGGGERRGVGGEGGERQSVRTLREPHNTQLTDPYIAVWSAPEL